MSPILSNLRNVFASYDTIKARETQLLQKYDSVRIYIAQCYRKSYLPKMSFGKILLAILSLSAMQGAMIGDGNQLTKSGYGVFYTSQPAYGSLYAAADSGDPTSVNYTESPSQAIAGYHDSILISGIAGTNGILDLSYLYSHFTDTYYHGNSAAYLTGTGLTYPSNQPIPDAQGTTILGKITFQYNVPFALDAKVEIDTSYGGGSNFSLSLAKLFVEGKQTVTYASSSGTAYNFVADPNAVTTPEPSTMAFLISGTLSLVAVRIMRRRTGDV